MGHAGRSSEDVGSEHQHHEPRLSSQEGKQSPFAAERAALLRQLEARGIRSRVVLDAIASVPREEFVRPDLVELAYADRALPIALEQTISQPYIVALMTELAAVGPGARVLEVGTGCGYQTAVLAATGAEVHSVEILEDLARDAAARLGRLGIDAELHVGDGRRGLPEHAPYDAIVVTAAPDDVPRSLVDQLALGGRLVVPVGEREADQQLVVVRRTPSGEVVEHIAAVRFVPLTGN